MIRKYFPGLDIVGWMQSQPGYGVLLNPGYSDYHVQNFTRLYHSMFVPDPIEKVGALYTYDKDTDCATRAVTSSTTKNRGMNEYMMENRGMDLKPMPLQGENDEENGAAPAERGFRSEAPEVMITKRQIKRNVRRAAAERKPTRSRRSAAASLPKPRAPA